MKSGLLVLGLQFLSVFCSVSVCGQSWDELVATADSLQEQHNYDSAISISKLALSVAEAELGQQDTVVARIYHQLAVQHRSLRKYSEAEPFALLALRIRESVLGSDHTDVVQSLQYLGIIYYSQRRLTEAGTYYERVIATVEKTMGPEHATLGNSLSSLAIVRRLQGRLTEADSLYERAVTVSRTRNEQGSAILAICLANKAVLSQMLGRLDDAEQGFLEALAIKQRILDPDHWAIASSMNHLGNFYRDVGRYDESENFLLQALAFEKRIFDPEYPSIAQTQYNLAMLYRTQGRYAEAELALGRAITIWENAYGPRHYLVALALESMCQLKRSEGDPSAAIGFAERASRLRLRHVLDHSAMMPEHDALVASQEMRRSVGGYLASLFDLDSADHATVERTVDLIVSSKGAVSDGMFWRGRTLVEESDTAVLTLAASLNSLRLQQSRLFVAGPGPNLDEHRRIVDSLEQATVLIGAELFHHSATYREREAYKNIDTKQLLALLPDNAALVEYLRYDHYTNTSDSTIPHYLAMILSKGAKPEVVYLGGASAIDSTVGMYRKHMAYVSTAGSIATAADLEEYTDISRRLYQQIWQPIETHVTGRDMVIIAPDGALNTVSFAGLLDEDDTYLIGTCAIHYLSAARDIVRMNDPPETGTGLFALGNPDYDASLQDRSTSLPVPVDTVSEPGYGTVEQVRSIGGDLNNITLSPLPGTQKEIQEITLAWKESSDEPVVTCLGSAATEDHFRAQAPGKRVIHLATHGYFLGDRYESDTSDNRAESEMRYLGENPLLHSGLFFAGANHHGQGADSAGVEDGILTAYEVSALDLRGTELVVLSACETGLGQIHSGEGVYGLRRAFQMAGTETVISTLWSVSDQLTAEMSSQLYDRKGVSLPEMIRRVQLKRIAELRRQGKVDHPIDWGAIVAYGNWR